MDIKILDKQLSKFGNTFDYINSGGCACVAAMLATHLRHEFPIMRIIASGWGNDNQNLDIIRETMNDNLDKEDWADNISFDHVWVEVLFNHNWYALDSTGVKRIKQMYQQWRYPAKGSFTIEEVQALADTITWNSTFNRKQLGDMQLTITNTITGNTQS